MQLEKRGVRDHDRNSSAGTKVSAEGDAAEGGAGAGGAPDTKAEIALQPVGQTMIMQLSPCSLWRSAVKQRHT